MRATLGPRSKSVLIQKRFGPPIVCNDGVTIGRAAGDLTANEVIDTMKAICAHSVPGKLAERRREAAHA